MKAFSELSIAQVTMITDTMIKESLRERDPISLPSSLVEGCCMLAVVGCYWITLSLWQLLIERYSSISELCELK